jgi:hypothetical protein
MDLVRIQRHTYRAGSEDGNGQECHQAEMQRVKPQRPLRIEASNIGI